jgi:peroxiredoxin (alkyl hydroperoxide reductase subunit C)
VSTDTKFVHLAWQKDGKMLEKVRYIMGSDPNARISKIFGVYDEEAGLDLRGTFIISPDGILMNSEVNYFNLGRNVEEILRKVKANIYLASHQNEGCPAKWQKEGDKTLKPSAELVGRVFYALE